MIGRDDVLGVLRGALDEVAVRGGRLLLLTGEAGMGKTTVLADAARHAEASGARVAWGPGWPGDGAPAYWPWIQILRELDLDPPRSDGWPGADAAPASARFQLFDDVATRLVDAAADRPLTLLLDDLQWADPQSLRLLDFLSRRLPAARIALIGGYREPAEPGGPLAALAARHPVLPLAGLPVDAVAALIAGVLGPERAGEVAPDVHRRTGGNPFFCLQLAWLLKDGQTGVPPGVGEALRSRLDRLPPAAAAAVGVAAVAGRRFPADLLARATGAETADLIAALHEGVRGGVLVEESPGDYRFAHDLFREYLYERLPPAARSSAHLRIGQELAADRAAGADVAPAELARHFVHADPGSPAARRYAVEAARDAAARLAYEDAVHHWERALAATAPPDRLDTLLDLADARRRAGFGAAAEEEFLRAADLARRHGDATGLARAALGLHAVGPGRARLSPRALAECLDEAHTALAVPRPGLDEDVRVPLRLTVQADLARVLAWRDLDLPRARRLAADAVRAARATDDPRLLATCLLAGHNAEWAPATAAHRREIAAELVSIAAGIGDADLLIEAYLLLANDLLELADPAFRPAVEEFLRLAEVSGQPRHRYAALARRALLALLAGRLDDAEELAGRAAALGEACGEPGALDVWFTQMWDIRGLQDRRAELAGAVVAAFPDPDSRPARGIQLLNDAAAGSVPIERINAMLDGDPDRPAPDSRQYLVDLVYGAEIAAGPGGGAAAARLYAALEPYAGCVVVAGAAVTLRGTVTHHLGVLAAAMGRPDLATAHLRDAVAVYTRLGASALAARSRAELDRLGVTAGPPAAFVRDGAMWTLGWGGRSVRMRDAKGLRDLAVLIAVPGRPVAAADLVAAAAGDAARADLALGADEVLDATARRQVRARLADLEDDITEADARADLGRAARARAEKDALIGELAAAAGFRGGARRLGDPWERARKTVTARIRDIIDRVARVHPDLGEHLRSSVTTGSHCCYSPPSPVDWRL